MLKKLSLLALTLLLPASLFLAACGDDDSDSGGSAPSASTGAAADVESAIESAVEAFNDGDAATFLAAWTDRGLEDEFGASRQELMAAGEDLFGGPPREVRNIDNTKVSGDKATTDVEFVIAKGIEKERLDLVQQGGAWKIDGTERLEIQLPSGTTGIDLKLDEFSFEWDAKVSNGNIAFKAENIGEQQHELVVMKVPANFNLQAALQSPEIPEGTEFIGFIGPVDADEKGTLAFTEPLTPGRYVMLCFLPDEEDSSATPHVAKGMASEFTVPTQGGTTP